MLMQCLIDDASKLTSVREYTRGGATNPPAPPCPASHPAAPPEPAELNGPEEFPPELYGERQRAWEL